MQITELGLTARSYPEARAKAAKKGMELPSYKLLDRHFLKNFGSGIAKELLAHPEKGGVSQQDRDINDSITNLSIPASEVPRRAFGREGIGMVVVPKDGADGMETSGGRTWVHPQSIVVFNRMIQASHEWVPGKMHRSLGIPVAVSEEEFERLPEEEKRWLCRIAGEGVRPLVRVVDGLIRNGRRLVVAFYGAVSAFGVAGVAATAGGAEKTTGMARVHKPTRDEIKRFAGSAASAVQEIAGRVADKHLQPIRELIAAVEKL